LAIGAIGAPSASAAPANIDAGVGGDFFGAASYNHDAGTVAFMTWVGGGSHNVVASSKGPDGEALFSSGTISLGSTAVNGTQYAAIGAYPFSCTIHPGMNSSLNVNAGAPLARPDVELAVKTKSLKQALKKAEVKVRATITGGSGEQADIDLKLGKKKIGIGTATTSTKVLKIALTKKGHSALERKTKATVTATAAIEFGEPDTAKGKLK